MPTSVCVSGCKLDARDQYGCTAVYFAAKFGHVDVVRQLISAGADLNIADTKGWTPLASEYRWSGTGNKLIGCLNLPLANLSTGTPVGLLCTKPMIDF